MPNRGKLVTGVMFALGLAAASLAVWYRYQSAHRAGDFWGTATAQLIVDAPEVRALQLDAVEQPRFDEEGMELEPPDDPAVEFGNGYWKVLDTREASKARGLGNVRRALVQDASFQWRGRADDPSWQYALELNNGRLWATVLFDFDSRQAALAGGRRTVRLDPAASDTWRAFLVEQFATPESTISEPSETPEGAERPSEEKPADESPPEDKLPAGPSADKPAESP